MGGLFSAPKPVAVQPAPVEMPQQQQQAAVETAARTEAVAETASRDARVKAVERARRGLAGTIVTSARGVLDPAPAFAARKSLLGE
jgi:predicted oxidoreductase